MSCLLTAKFRCHRLEAGDDDAEAALEDPSMDISAQRQAEYDALVEQIRSAQLRNPRGDNNDDTTDGTGASHLELRIETETDAYTTPQVAAALHKVRFCLPDPCPARARSPPFMRAVSKAGHQVALLRQGAQALEQAAEAGGHPAQATSPSVRLHEMELGTSPGHGGG